MTERLRLPGALEAVREYNLTLESRFGALQSETLRFGLSYLAEEPESCTRFMDVCTTISSISDPEVVEVGLGYALDVHEKFTNPKIGHETFCPVHHDEVLFYQIHDN